MPLLPDPEFEAEIDGVFETTINEDKAARKKRFIFLLLFLSAVLVCVEMLGLETGAKLSIVIISCSLAIMWVVYDAFIILHVSLVLVMSAVEWVGRKQLGEYEPPP
jgi:hypothetical protein